MASLVHQFNSVIAIVGGQTLRDYSDGGSSIVIEYANDLTNTVEGTDGSHVINVIHSTLATVTFSLNPGAPANDVFSAIALAIKRVGLIAPNPILIKDSNGRDLHVSPHMSLKTQPPTTYEGNATPRVWVFEGSLDSYWGGGIRLG
jgi:hypothetical protein